MKKAISLVLCILMLAGTVVFAANAETVYYDIATSAEHGTITVDVEQAKEGDIVFVEVKPDDGYYYVEGSLKYGYDTGVAIGKDAAGYYSFTMPHDDITITASFKENPSVLETLWNGIKPAGKPALNVLKSLLPLLKAFFANIVSIGKAIFSNLDIDLPF